MTAECIARALGETYRSSSGWWNTRCPRCQGDGKLGLKDDGHRLIVSCFRGCRREDILVEIERFAVTEDDDLVDHLPEDPAQAERRRQAEAARRHRKIDEANDIWMTSIPQTSTSQITNYLRGRGIDIAIPDTIRLHGMHGPYGLHYISGERRPSMIGLIEHGEHGIIGVSRTFLAIDGSTKAAFEKPRIFTGVVKGGAVKLGAVRRDDWLVIGEGIESTLSAMQMFALPGWAALSATGIGAVMLPPQAEKVLICADNDANGVGAQAAEQAALRWLAEGRRVKICIAAHPRHRLQR
jgi:putative DNA primase/helicase